jgi:hypothetical protein
MNGKIYRLINTIDNDEYIGSTCNRLSHRLSVHKCHAKTKREIKVYKHLNEVGWDNVRIILIQEYPCQSKMELERQEAHWIRELKPSLNCKIPRRSKSELYLDKKEEILDKQKIYYEQNKDDIAQKSKVYREENKEVIRERKAKYREENKEVIRERKAKYCADNAEKVRCAKAKYYNENKEYFSKKNETYRATNAENIREYQQQYRHWYQSYNNDKFTLPSLYINTQLGAQQIAPGATLQYKKVQVGYNYNIIQGAGNVTLGYKIF